MEIKSLMVGDWVMVKHTHREPSAERAEGVGRDVVLIKTDSGMQSFGYDKLTLIPLTPEILEANGFIIRRDEYYLSCGFLGNDWSRSGVEVKFYDRAVIDIECNYFKHTNRVHLIADYVHEFQHALRLCGLNEIADNFKVE